MRLTLVGLLKYRIFVKMLFKVITQKKQSTTLY